MSEVSFSRLSNSPLDVTIERCSFHALVACHTASANRILSSIHLYSMKQDLFESNFLFPQSLSKSLHGKQNNDCGIAPYKPTSPNTLSVHHFWKKNCFWKCLFLIIWQVGRHVKYSHFPKVSIILLFITLFF